MIYTALIMHTFYLTFASILINLTIDHVEHNLSILSIRSIPKSLHVYDLQQFNLCCIFKIYLHDFPQLKSLSTLSQRLSYYTFKVVV